MEECDRAIRLLPETRNNPGEEAQGDKWTAYARSQGQHYMQLRAKYWDKAPLEGSGG